MTSNKLLSSLAKLSLMAFLALTLIHCGGGPPEAVCKDLAALDMEAKVKPCRENPTFNFTFNFDQTKCEAGFAPGGACLNDSDPATYRSFHTCLANLPTCSKDDAVGWVNKFGDCLKTLGNLSLTCQAG